MKFLEYILIIIINKLQQNIKEKDDQEKNINELKEEMNEKSVFHLFRIDINDFWNIFIEPSFIPTYFSDNSKITNIKDIDKVLKEINKQFN